MSALDTTLVPLRQVGHKDMAKELCDRYSAALGRQQLGSDMVELIQIFVATSVAYVHGHEWTARVRRARVGPATRVSDRAFVCAAADRIRKRAGASKVGARVASVLVDVLNTPPQHRIGVAQLRQALASTLPHMYR